MPCSALILACSSRMPFGSLVRSARALGGGRGLRLCSLIQHLQFGLLILQHALLGAYPGLQLEDAFRVAGPICARARRRPRLASVQPDTAPAVWSAHSAACPARRLSWPAARGCLSGRWSDLRARSAAAAACVCAA